MMTETQHLIDRFWSHELGINSSLESAPKIYCTTQRLYSGVQLFRKGDRLVMAATPGRFKFVQQAIVGLPAEELFRLEWLESVFGKDAERILGPAEVNYADETSFRSNAKHTARALSTSDSI